MCVASSYQFSANLIERKQCSFFKELVMQRRFTFQTFFSVPQLINSRALVVISTSFVRASRVHPAIRVTFCRLVLDKMSGRVNGLIMVEL